MADDDTTPAAVTQAVLRAWTDDLAFRADCARHTAVALGEESPSLISESVEAQAAFSSFVRHRLVGQLREAR